MVLYRVAKSEVKTDTSARGNLFIKALIGRGIVYGHIGRLDQGIADYERVIHETVDSVCYARERSDIMLNLAGLMGEGKSDFVKAQVLVQRALAGTDRRKTPAIYAHAAQIMGNIHKNLGKIDQALEDYRQSLALFKKSRDRAGQAGDYCNLGLIHLRRRELMEAERNFRFYRRISRSMGDQVGTARSLNNLAIVKIYGNDLSAAEKLYRKSLAISQKVGNKMGIGITCGELGLLCKNRGELDRALQYYGQYLDIAQELGFRMGIGIVNLNIADVYFSKRDWHRALVHYRRSQAEAVRIGDREGVALCLTGIGKVRLEQGCGREAVICLKKARALFDRLQMKAEESDAIYHVGLALETLGRKAKAQNCYRESYDLAKKTGDPGLIATIRGKLEKAND